jgi:hypothetical protein
MNPAPLQPMTLGNMRANGVHALPYDGLGHHHRVLDVSNYPDDVPVPSFGARMVCTVCGAIGADVRPNWNERAPRSFILSLFVEYLGSTLWIDELQTQPDRRVHQTPTIYCGVRRHVLPIIIRRPY